MYEGNYEKIKHLVEIDNNILAVFTLLTEKGDHMDNLFIAKDADITKNFIDRIFANLKITFGFARRYSDIKDIVGELKWTVMEFDKTRMLLLRGSDNLVVVLIKSNTSLHSTVDNILGYYYEEEAVPKSLF